MRGRRSHQRCGSTAGRTSLTDLRTRTRLAGVGRRDRHAAHPSRAPTAASSGRSPRLRRLAAALQADPGALSRRPHSGPARLCAQLRHHAKSPLPPPLPLTPGSLEGPCMCGIGSVRGNGYKAGGDRGCAANDRIRDAARGPATMPIESISACAIALATSDRGARLQDLKRVLKDACGARHASRQQAERAARVRESVRDEG